MPMNRSFSGAWIWGLGAVAVLILILGQVVGPGSPDAQLPVAADTVEALPPQLEPIGDAPGSYPVLSEPRETGLQDAFDQQRTAGEPEPEL